jgi:hypothetical protein
LLDPIEVTLEPDLVMHGFADVDVQAHIIHQTGYRLEDAKDVGFAARPAYSCQIFHNALHGAEVDAQADRFGAAGEHEAHLEDVFNRRKCAEAIG